MTILWFCNTLIPEVGNKIGVYYRKPESWITSLYSILKDNETERIVYVFAHSEAVDAIQDSYGNTFVSFCRDSRSLCEDFIRILNNYKPDIVHIHGTENPAIQVFIEALKITNLLDYSVLSIQGVLLAIAEHWSL